ncbi:MAG: aspartate aminotransferase, partial [Bacteroidetes bacterium]
MRAPAFSALVKECELMLLDLAGNPGGQVIPITASGTAAMEAAVLCYASTLTPIGILNGGGFGQRW